MLSQRKIPSIIVFVLGLIAFIPTFLAVALQLFGIYLRCAVSNCKGVVTADIVDVQMEYDDQDDDIPTVRANVKYRPVYQYVVDGKSYKITGSSRTVECRVGDKEVLKYNPDHPNRAISVDFDNTNETLHAINVASAVLFFVFALIPLCLFVSFFRRNRAIVKEERAIAKTRANPQPVGWWYLPRDQQPKEISETVYNVIKRRQDSYDSDYLANKKREKNLKKQYGSDAVEKQYFDDTENDFLSEEMRNESDNYLT